MKTSKKIYLIAMSIVFVVAAVIGFGTLNPSKPNETDQTRFNVANAYKHIEEIAKEPHSIFDQEAHTAVREYLLEELEALGANPEVYTYEDVYVERSQTKEDVRNIYGQIDGKNDSYIMLVTHYDTSRAKTERYAEVDGSCGAADAGYGLATILETLRLIKENNVELVNGIKILITDAEEYGLLGAKEAVKEDEIFENVNYLINLEARGVKGPAIMFETSIDNQSVIELYQKSPKAFSYSINPEIYRILPNGTDFSVFLKEGIKGINIAVLDSLDYYHTPNDSVEHVSLQSLQHYGDQVVPIVTEFVTNETYQDGEVLSSTEDSIFFTFTKNIFIKYSHGMNYLLLGLILLGVAVFVRSRQIKVLTALKYTAMNFGLCMGFAALAYGVSRVVAQFMGKPFKVSYLPLVPYEEVILLGLFAAVFIIYHIVVYVATKKKKETEAYCAGVLLLLWLFSVLFTVVLPGGSYLTVFPAIVTVVGLLVSGLLTKYVGAKGAYVMLLPLSLVVILFVPTIYLFNCALTFGGVAANMIFVFVAYMVIVSCQVEMKRHLEK
ncbi:MAG: M20/M25/M40 family metallo-hydrolase [Cellulosilyticaceae bacterium]